MDNHEHPEFVDSDPTATFTVAPFDMDDVQHDSQHDELRGLVPSVRRRRRRRQLLATGASILAASALLFGCMATADPDDPTPQAAAGDGAVPAEVDSDALEDQLSANDPSPLPGDSDGVPEAPQPDPDPDPGDDDSGGGLDPVPQPEPQPCDALPADGSSLLVGPDPMVLDDGTSTGTITIRNCSDGDVDWTANTVPTVTLDSALATVLPGEVAELGFQIDFDAYEAGAIDFKVKVYEDGHSHYVDVHAFRPLLGKDVVAGDNTLSGGAGAGGCADQCIVKALLRSNATTPNLALDVETNTEASVRVYVSTDEPVITDDVPSFPGVAAIDTSPVGITEWTAQLTPLDPSTTYFIIVSATDINEHTAYRTGSFTTIEPFDPGGNKESTGEEPGCSAECIVSAVLTPGADYSRQDFTMTTHTPAQMQLNASLDEPQWNDGVPSFELADSWAISGLEYTQEWSGTLEGLYADTTYHVIAEATDANGNTSYAAGTFHTQDAPTYDVAFTVLSIHVQHDGDHGINRGELSFSWSVGDTEIGTRGEQKLSDGDRTSFPDSSSAYVVHDVSGFMPTVRVSGSERDADGLVEFETCGTGTMQDPGWNESCDITWNVADSGLVGVEGIDSLPLCTDLGADDAWAGIHCMLLQTPDDLGGGYPRFDVLVAVQST